ncbi:hypothetical protein RCF45_11815, partial [Staphylococcus aureus]|nr:hypothetical protein [Staphylococcus aureus]
RFVTVKGICMVSLMLVILHKWTVFIQHLINLYILINNIR